MVARHGLQIDLGSTERVIERQVLVEQRDRDGAGGLFDTKVVVLVPGGIQCLGLDGGLDRHVIALFKQHIKSSKQINRHHQSTALSFTAKERERERSIP
jgi:hypothetical protein